MKSLVLVLVCSSAQAQVTVWSDLGHPPVIVRKTSDQSTSSTSYVNATELGWLVGANKSYAFLCHVSFQSSLVTNGFALSVNGPAAPVGLEYQTSYQVQANDGVASEKLMDERHDIAYDMMASTSATITANVDLAATIVGTFVNGPSDGTFSLRVKSETSGASITIKRGSWCTFF